MQIVIIKNKIKRNVTTKNMSNFETLHTFPIGNIKKYKTMLKSANTHGLVIADF